MPPILAQVVPLTPEAGLDLYAKVIWEAVTGQNWRYLAALLVVGLVWGLSKLLAGKVPFLGTGAGKAITALVVGVLGGLATAFAAGKPSLEAILHGASLGFLASGGWSAVKHIIELWRPAPVVVAVPPVP